jgi:hypothetical protein
LGKTTFSPKKLMVKSCYLSIKYRARMQITHLTVVLALALALAATVNLSVGEPGDTISGAEIRTKAVNWTAHCGFTPSWERTCALGVSTPYMGADHVGILVVETDMDGSSPSVSARGFYPRRPFGLGGMAAFMLSAVFPIPGELRRDGILRSAFRNNATITVRWVAEPSYRKVLNARHYVPRLYHPLGLMPFAGNCVTAARTVREQFTGDSIPIGWVVAQVLGWAAFLAVLLSLGSRYPRAIARYLLAWAVIVIAA